MNITEPCIELMMWEEDKFVSAHAFIAFLWYFWFWMGDIEVVRWNGDDFLVPKHLQKSKIGLLEQIWAKNPYVTFCLGHPVYLGSLPRIISRTCLDSLVLFIFYQWWNPMVWQVRRQYWNLPRVHRRLQHPDLAHHRKILPGFIWKLWFKTVISLVMTWVHLSFKLPAIS